MPIPHHATAPDAPTAHRALAVLRRRGLRVSRPRRLLLEALYTGPVPMTAEQLAAGAHDRAPAGDLATVYRNLGALEEAGLVRHTHLAGGPACWAPAAAVREVAACEWCGARVELPDEVLARVRSALRGALGFEPHFDHTPLAGLCARCAARSGLRASTPPCSSSSTSTARCC